MFELLVKTAISIISVIAILLFIYSEPWSFVRNLQRQPQTILLFFVVCRVIPYIAIYLVIGLSAQSDVIAYFWPQALQAQQGQLVYRDFGSHYSPFFAYILAGAIFLWNDPRAIVLLMVIIEGLALLVTYLLFFKETRNPGCIRAALIYLMLPAPFLLKLLGGQEEVWMWLAAMPFFWFAIQGRPLLAASVAMVGFLVTKALFVLVLILPILVMRKPLMYMTGLGAIGSITFLPLWFFVGNDLFMPLSEGSSVSPPNLWFTINALSGGLIPLGNPVLSFTGLGLTLALSCMFFWVHREQICDSIQGYAIGWIFLFCCLMLLSPKSLGNYVAIYLMPLTFLVVLLHDRFAFYLMLVLNVLASIQTSLWYRLGSPTHTNFSFLTNIPELLDFTMQLGMLMIFALLMYRSWLWLSTMPEYNMRSDTSTFSVEYR